MAYILTPRFVPVQAPQCGPFGFCAPQPRSYGYRVARPQPRRPTYSSFNHFFHQVDELLTDIEREAQRQAALEAHIEAQREAHRQRQQRKRALRANFNVNQTEQGWEVEGDIRGFEQQNINIEVTDAQTLKISGNTRWEPEQPQSEPAQQPSIETAPTTEQPTEQTSDEHMDGVTLNEPEAEVTTGHDSDTESHKSYQATVEDDFEDLGAETSSLISASSTSTVAEEPQEPKGKEKAVEETPAEDQPETQPTETQEQPQEQERVHGSFERTLKFPARIDAANVTAHFEGGVLKINVPKAEVEQVRRIAIL